MTDRAELAQTFLNGAGWGDARRAPLAGDASNRRYERLTNTATGQPAVLMDAPPERGEDVRPFVRMAMYLRSLGLSAPAILAEDPEHGFLLLEDLGDDLFARVIPGQPKLEPELYRAATDALVSLHRAAPLDLPVYDPARMTQLAALAFEKYAAGINGAIDHIELKHFSDRFEPLLQSAADGPHVVIQRDYHAENLLWLPHQDGPARVGLLDFQDAMLGHPAYDLVSLLQDARRDVPAGIEARMIDHYLEETGLDAHLFRTAYAALGVQRNLRILGVFARLGIDYGKPWYIDLIPRVWDHVVRDLEHPVLAPVAAQILEALPTPTSSNLDILRSKCPTP